MAAAVVVGGVVVVVVGGKSVKGVHPIPAGREIGGSVEVPEKAVTGLSGEIVTALVGRKNGVLPMASTTGATVEGPAPTAGTPPPVKSWRIPTILFTSAGVRTVEETAPGAPVVAATFGSGAMKEVPFEAPAVSTIKLGAPVTDGSTSGVATVTSAIPVGGAPGPDS